MIHFPNFWGKTIFPEIWLSCTTSYRFVALCQNLDDTYDTIPRKRRPYFIGLFRLPSGVQKVCKFGNFMKCVYADTNAIYFQMHHRECLVNLFYIKLRAINMLHLNLSMKSVKQLTLLYINFFTGMFQKFCLSQSIHLTLSTEKRH